MNWHNIESRYGSLPIGLHWHLLLLIAGAYACIELRGNFPKESDIREGPKT
jgi:superoxide oxidase